MTYGRFVWHDLMTTQPEKAREFYTKLFGWAAIDGETPDGHYTMWQLGERKLGGMVTMKAEEGVPPHWMPYVSVPKLEEVLEKAKRLGAKQVTPVLEVPQVGRWAVIADPQGGYISPFEVASGRPMPPPPGEHEMEPVGLFCWEELNSTDPAASVRFYSELFGWLVETTEMESFGAYHLLYAGQEQVGGVGPVQGPPMTYWLSYVHVDDVDATAKQVTELGGQVHYGPADIPGIGRFAVIADPTGGALALYKSARK
jgi:predicted enzyme related to lactoylglutathione lyase